MKTLRIATWNCFGAAQSARALLLREGAPEPLRFRHREVTAFLEAADVICIQEVWVRDAMALFARLAFPHKVQDDNRAEWWPPTIGGAGLAVATRPPLVARRLAAYSRPHAGAERFARKGVLHARVALGAGELDVVTTHLQSGSSVAAVCVRARQLAELATLIEGVGAAERPMLVCGDFNIDGYGSGSTEYAALTRVLAGFRDLGAEADQPTYYPDPAYNRLASRYDRDRRPQRLDYMFYRAAARGPRVSAFARALDVPLYADVHPSDHFALVVDLELA